MPRELPTTGEEATYFSGARVPPQQAPSASADNVIVTPGTPVTELPPQTVAPPPPPAPPSIPAPSQTPGPAQRVQFRPINRNESAIRLRRLRQPQTSNRLTPIRSHQPQTQAQDWGNVGVGRRRSSSEPQRPYISDGDLSETLPRVVMLAPVQETTSNVEGGEGESTVVPILAEDPTQPGRFRRILGRRRGGQTIVNPSTAAAANGQQGDDDVYDSRIVDFLDVIDPEVATLSSITNIQNSLFLPSLGKWVNRRPTYDLSHLPPIPGAFPPSKESVAAVEQDILQEREGQQSRPSPVRSPSLSSVLSSEPQYAILPNNASLEGWKEEDVKLLNDYVRHMLHSRRSKIKQRFKAFGQYCRRPLGFLITLYATLITLFGLAWVLFLIGWIYVGEKQLYVINVIDYILVALFAIVGDGMAPFRAVDTYHMFFVAKYHRKTWKMRKKLLLPALKDHNDLPKPDDPDPASQSRTNSADEKDKDVEAQKDKYYPVLSDKEQERLIHHQNKLAKSHTFYKPHETETHHAFPLRLLITVVLLLDLHSCLQISLGAVTWGIPYETRPAAATTTILCCSIATNILAGVLISVGDRRTRKKEVLDRLMRQDMTEEMMKKIVKKKQKEEEEKEKAEGRDSKDDGGKARVNLGKGISVPLPWRNSDDGNSSKMRKSVDEKGIGKTEDQKRARSLSISRDSKERGKGRPKVGRFSSDAGVAEGRKGLENNDNGDGNGKGKEKELRIPGAFNEDDEVGSP